MISLVSMDILYLSLWPHLWRKHEGHSLSPKVADVSMTSTSNTQVFYYHQILPCPADKPMACDNGPVVVSSRLAGAQRGTVVSLTCGFQAFCFSRRVSFPIAMPCCREPLSDSLCVGEDSETRFFSAQ